MLNSKSFLAVDFGAANLKLAEFELTESGGLLLTQYGLKSLGLEGSNETARESAMVQALQELLKEKSFHSKAVNVCAPGFHTFSKFVKLPPVDTSKVPQLIHYEAQQNFPFPLDEVVWDYQILGASPSGELVVLLVAIKSDIVEDLFKVAESAGLRLQLVDVSAAALCNAFRYNYPDLEGCSMVLDIGAKTSNLLFFEKNVVFARSINIGAQSITLDFAKESRMSFAEAEQLKVDEGFVSLGGAYEEPENPNQAAISKIARQVLTRLHIQVNQTIQVYRSQQGGSAPQRLFLSGGASIMPYTAQFFSEKLNLAAEEVQYFNPLRSVEIAPDINREELAKVAHSLGEVVGLGLRNLAHCPIELNLMPKSFLKRQQLSQKKPYFAASVLCLILIVYALGWFYDQVASKKTKSLEQLNAQLLPRQRNDTALKEAMRQLKAAELEGEQYAALVQDRFYWGDMFTQLRSALIAVEDRQEQLLKTKTGVWIEKFTPVLCNAVQYGTTGPWLVEAATSTATVPGADEPPPPPTRRKGKATFSQGPESSSDTAICKVVMHCRAVNMSAAGASANTGIAFDVAKQLGTLTGYFETNGISPGNLTLDPSELTFSFEITAKLKRPLKP